MTNDGNGDRHSYALSPELVTDPVAKAETEARNGLRQFDGAIEIIDSWVRDPNRSFKLRPSTILHLHRLALDGLSSFAGNYRPAGVEIKGSEHEPVGAHLVPEAIEELCDYVNDNWENRSALHISAYVMWRLNWIHPFDDGNGRTARMISYVVLCARLGSQLPGRYTIPEQIAENKKPYYDALEAADTAWANEEVDVSKMEALLGDMLGKQLYEVYQSAQGGDSEPHSPIPKLH